MQKIKNVHPVCIITGATSGIGRATALSLAQIGYNIIAIGRNKKRCADLEIELKKICVPGTTGKCYIADLSNLEETRRITREIITEFDRIDILINNVGARFMNFQRNSEGIEMTLALNHLSGFLLTTQLLDLLKNSSSGRIINISSGAHARSLDYGWLREPEPYDGRKAYAQSKLCNLLFTLALAQRLAKHGITVNAADPGGTATRFNRNNGLHYWLRHLVAHLLSRDLSTAQKAAKTPVFLASSTQVKGVSGKLFHKCQVVDTFPDLYNESEAEVLWDLSEELTHTLDTNKKAINKERSDYG